MHIHTGVESECSIRVIGRFRWDWEQDASTEKWEKYDTGLNEGDQEVQIRSDSISGREVRMPWGN